MIKNENLKLLPKYEEYIVYVNKMIIYKKRLNMNYVIHI